MADLFKICKSATIVACFAGCAGNQTAPSSLQATTDIAKTRQAVTSAPVQKTHDTSVLEACPMQLSGVHLTTLPTNRGIAMLFTLEAPGNEAELARRAQQLAERYNAVYGESGNRTSWGHVEEYANGDVRLQFEIFAETDLDASLERVPREYEGRLDALRRRIDGAANRMQGGQPCTLSSGLVRLNKRASLPESPSKS